MLIINDCTVRIAHVCEGFFALPRQQLQSRLLTVPGEAGLVPGIFHAFGIL